MNVNALGFVVLPARYTRPHFLVALGLYLQMLASKSKGMYDNERAVARQKSGPKVKALWREPFFCLDFLLLFHQGKT
jgi:hypothetical protein